MPPSKYPPQAASFAGRLPHLSHSRLPPLLAPAAQKLAAGSARVYTDRGRVAGGRRKRAIEFGGGEICLVGGRRRQPRHRESQLICRGSLLPISRDPLAGTSRDDGRRWANKTMIRDGNNQEAADVEELLAQQNKHAAVATSRQWSAQTESRIVRVSRVFGGKDRHSKVKTVKGLRDRRVRLSVPTAIQLYDLQDRLGLNQPSKVVDWLLNAARHEIDKLPPLQFPPQDLMVGHLTPHMPLVHEEKFGHIAAAAALASDGAKVGVGQGDVDVDIDGSAAGAHHLGRFPGGGYHRFMELNSALGMVSSAMAPYNNYTGEAWNNNGAGGSPQVVAAASAAHRSPFPSLLSLAPRPHQLAFYSSETDQQFQVENLGSQSLSLSSARAYHDQAS